ncbi:MAG: radical SAM protein [Planctomycetota bacterium]
MKANRRVLLTQLPIPPTGPQPIRGNVPLAAGYLKLYARHLGLDADYDIEILPSAIANTASDRGMVRQILARDPWMVGFTCYLWNIDRSLWIAERLKEQNPNLRIVVGGPEITADNEWVLANPAVDYAVIGEGEQTFAALLADLRTQAVASPAIHGLHVKNRSLMAPHFRTPLPRLDVVSSPYLEGILDAADERMLFLETIRGCVFKCKFCYYPKSYDQLYFVSEEKIVANLEHARQRGAREVVLLDPTLNQRKDFTDFLKLLTRCNPDKQFTYFGELRGEGVTRETARLLREANFNEVEIGLQSVDPNAQTLMDRKNHLKAFERGAKAMMDEGIKVKVDLIIGLPGDTVDSVRQGIEYLREKGLYDDVQVFNLAILPGTAFRQEHRQLGLEFQPKPPYYVLRTPTLELSDMYQLMEEAQDAFEIDFDPLPAPELDESLAGDPSRCWQTDFDRATRAPCAPPDERTLVFTLWFKGSDLARHVAEMRTIIHDVQKGNPHGTLQILLEPTADPQVVNDEVLAAVNDACQAMPSYLDRFYAVLPGPGRAVGAKRIIILLPLAYRASLGQDWVQHMAEYATLLWRGEEPADEPLAEHEFVVSP